jgi:hypothetical protein
MNDEQIRQLLQKLGIVLECPRCGHKYDLEDISLRSYNGSTYNLKLVCNLCHTPVTASIAISGDLKNIAENFASLAPSAQKIFDIAKPQSKKPARKLKITNDDILDMHQYLKEFDGNFEKIFEK